ncbi:MAG: TolC family protein [Gemmatimonadota bacterium]
MTRRTVLLCLGLMVLGVLPGAPSAVYAQRRAAASIGAERGDVSGAVRRSAGDTLVLSLADAERMALERSPLLAPAAAGVRISEARLDQARHARILPEFSLRNLWGPIPRQRGVFTETGVLTSPDTILGLRDLRWFTQFDLNMVQPLYTFGKIGSRVTAAQQNIEASRAELERTRAEVLLGVRQLYWGVVLSRELDEVSRSVRNRVDEAEETLQKQYDEGTATQNDMFKFRLFKYQIGQRVRELTAEAEKARAAFRAALGLEDDVTFRPADASLKAMDVELDDLSAYLALARAYRPELEQLRSGIAARNALARAARSDGLPTLFLAGTLSFNVAPSRFDPRNPFWYNRTNYFRPGIALGVDWKLNFLQHRDAYRLERYEADKLEAQAEPLRLSVESEVRAAYLDAVRAKEDVEDGKGALRAGENWLRAELQSFDLGLGEIGDVIDAFQANIAMQVEQLHNIANFNTALARLSRSTGRDIGYER